MPFGVLGRRLIPHLDFLTVNAKANREIILKIDEVQPQIVIVMGRAPTRAATLAQIKINYPEIKLVNIYPDPIHNLHAEQIASLAMYDLFGIHTKAAVPYLQKFGCSNACYLPLAADPELHYPIELSEQDRIEFGADVVFVGNWRAEHEQMLSALEGFELAIWGPNWGRKAQRGSWVRRCWRGRTLTTGAEYAKAHLAAKIGLNPIDLLNRTTHDQRLFELPACGAFALVTRTDEVMELFQEGETVDCFGTPEELVNKVIYYLEHEDERREIARKSYEFVLSDGHTYRERAQTILEKLNL